MESLFRDYEIIIRSGWFDRSHYLATYPDVARRNIDPLIHYLEEGARAARNPHPDFDAVFYLAQCKLHGHAPANPLLHYITQGLALGLKTKRDEAVPAPPDVPAADALSESDGASSGDLPVVAQPAMRLYVDEATVNRRGVLRVDGWAVCLAPLAAVEMILDEVSLGAAELGRIRPDVEAMLPDYPNARTSGFLFVADVTGFPPGAKSLTVRAAALTGIVRELVRPVDLPDVRERGPAPEAAARYHCDQLALTAGGSVSVSGWVVCPSPTALIEVLLDGKKLGDAACGIERADVGNLFPSLAHARRSGFAATARCDGGLAGEHLIALRVTCTDGRVEEIVLPVPAIAVEDAPLAAAVATAALELTLDTPTVVDGTMATPVRGNLEISGWALARAGVAAIDIVVDDVVLTTAEYGIRRLDVQSAFPDWESARDSGFLALLPHRLLPQGAHRLSVTLRDKAGATRGIEFRVVVEPLPEGIGPWALHRRIPAAEADLARRLLARQDWQPAFEVALAVAGDADLRDAYTTVASLRTQLYPNWRLAVRWDPAAGRAGDIWHNRLTEMLESLGDRARRVSGFPADRLDGAASFLAVLMPGSELGCDAFLEMALATVQHRDADFFYSDERRRNPASGEIEAFFKPQWSPDLLLATNYVGQLWCARGDLVRRAVAAKEDLLRLAAYDLVLRCTEAAAAIRHVPAVLCECAAAPAVDAARERRALARAVRRRGLAAEILPGAIAGSHRVKRRLDADGLVSIIIPTRAAQGMIKRCIETIRSLTAYRNFEVVCVENIPPAQAHWREWLRSNADRVVSVPDPFNWSRFNNAAAAAARGEFLLFLNDDIEIVDPEWLGVLLAQAQRPEIGAVGPMLLYPDRRIQHAGMFLAGTAQARHAFRYAAEDEPGYFGLALTERNVIAVTGACLMTRREIFDRLGGFDEAHDIVNNDVDYCLRVWQAGLLTIYTPHTRLIHHEAVSRADMADDFDAAAFDHKWRHVFLRGDPFFSPHLSTARDAVAPDDEPNRIMVAGRPVLLREDIRKILVVKLDHIGDCIMAFPAVRRLKRHFPDALISVLTSRASRAVWGMEAAVDATIEFDFFHARSALGQVELSDEDWRALSDRLIPERFDLAVDLRKHLETRPVLRHTGARYLAGVDHRGRFPWLDIATEWSGDQAYTHKRQHNIDDLVNLVDAIAASCDTDRRLIVRAPAEASPELGRLIAPAGGRRLVCLHPTAGNDMKQWPLDYFAAVADRLVQEDDVRIALIGGPGEEATGARLLERMRCADAALSLIGKLPLSELPALLVRCALFLGNDSGPKHIAAGLGVPTVAVQSGSVDIYEWGPVGPHAVAVARDVACTPCYLPAPGDCRRDLACLKRLAPARVYAACKRLLLAAG